MRRHINPLAGALAAILTALALRGSARAASTSPADDFAAAQAAAFTEADANGDGQLSATEFASFEELLHQKLEALRFSQLDTNGDGELTLDELKAGHPPGPPPFGHF
jgi:Ca2+-binding EF-hand superfamily protein